MFTIKNKRKTKGDDRYINKKIVYLIIILSIINFFSHSIPRNMLATCHNENTELIEQASCMVHYRHTFLKYSLAGMFISATITTLSLIMLFLIIKRKHIYLKKIGDKKG